MPRPPGLTTNGPVIPGSTACSPTGRVGWRRSGHQRQELTSPRITTISGVHTRQRPVVAVLTGAKKMEYSPTTARQRECPGGSASRRRATGRRGVGTASSSSPASPRATPTSRPVKRPMRRRRYRTGFQSCWNSCNCRAVALSWMVPRGTALIHACDLILCCGCWFGCQWVRSGCGAAAPPALGWLVRGHRGSSLVAVCSAGAGPGRTPAPGF
jgi:hypothetical protein